MTAFTDEWTRAEACEHYIAMLVENAADLSGYEKEKLACRLYELALEMRPPCISSGMLSPCAISTAALDD